MSKKIFVSLPMRGKEDYEIKANMERLFKMASAYVGEECELLDTFNPVTAEELQSNDIIDVAPLYLGSSIKLLSKADLAIFDKDWMTSNGCCVEKQVCERYNIEHIVEPALFGTFKETAENNY